MSWSNWLGLGSRPSISKIGVVYDKKEYAVTFTKDDYTKGDVKIGTLRNKLAELFKVPVRDLSLFQLEPRRKLSNDTAFLTDYGVKNGDRLLAMSRKATAETGGASSTGDHQTIATNTKQSAKSEDAQSVKSTASAKVPLSSREQIEEANKNVETNLGDRIKAFVASTPGTVKAREQEYRVLTEVILQNIIKLDNVEVGSDQELRQLRKEVINKFHHYHGEIDAANTAAEAREAQAGPAQAEAPDAAPGARENSPGSQKSTPKKSNNKKRKNKKR